MVEKFNTHEVERPKTSKEVIQETTSDLSNLKSEVKDHVKPKYVKGVLDKFFNKIKRSIDRKNGKKTESFTHTLPNVFQYYYLQDVDYETDSTIYISGETKRYEKDKNGMKIDMVVHGKTKLRFPSTDDSTVTWHYDADKGALTIDFRIPEEPMLEVADISLDVLSTKNRKLLKESDWKDFQSELMAQGIEGIKEQAIKDGIIEKGKIFMKEQIEKECREILDPFLKQTGYKANFNIYIGNEGQLNVPQQGA